MNSHLPVSGAVRVAVQRPEKSPLVLTSAGRRGAGCPPPRPPPAAEAALRGADLLLHAAGYWLAGEGLVVEVDGVHAGLAAGGLEGRSAE